MATEVNVDVPALLARLDIPHDRRGGELWALCPSHDDHRPTNWSINAETGVHNCFSCGFGGDYVALVVHVLALSRSLARDWIAGASGVAISRNGGTLALTAPEPRQLDACTLPAGVKGMGRPLDAWPTPVRRYIEKRELAGQVVRWGVGYALSGREAGRIVFPARNQKGRLLCYNGRSFTNQTPKYLRPSNGEPWDRSAIFGEQHWPDDRQFLLVSEGEINALANERACPPGRIDLGIAALVGSNLHDQQVGKLSTFANIIVISDPDVAGDKLWSAVRSKLARWATLQRVTLSVEDGDSADCDPAKLCDMIERATT